MAASAEQNGTSVSSSNAELLLHPELLSQDFMRLLLTEKNVSTRDCESRDRLMELYVRHVMPLPQRTLPDSRWGRRMEKSRGGRGAPGQRAESHSSSVNDNRKRPLIVYDGSSSHSGPLKVKKPEGSAAPPGTSDRLKPPPAANQSNPIRKLTGSTSSSSSSLHQGKDDTNLKREANTLDGLKSPEVKKKIQHVTWP